MISHERNMTRDGRGDRDGVNSISPRVLRKDGNGGEKRTLPTFG